MTRTRPFLLVAIVAGALLPGGAALPCSPPSPDAGNGNAPDARPPAGDFRVFSRTVSPGQVDLIPTNMRFTVTYSISADPGATLAWLGELTLRDAAQGDLPVDVVRLPSESYEARFQVTPRSPLPAYGYILLEDRFPSVPCGVDAVCTRGEPTLLEAYKTSASPDVTAPRLASQTINFSSWKRYSYVETCFNSTCAGLEANIQLPAATDEGPVTYRFRYPDGTVEESLAPGIFERLECTRCFHLGPSPEGRPLRLGPIAMTAVDWLGQESEGRIVLTLTQPDCSSGGYPDAGPGPGTPPAPDARPPSSDATPGPTAIDAGLQHASGGQPDDRAGAGCAVGGRGSAAAWLALAAPLLFLRRRRSGVNV